MGSEKGTLIADQSGGESIATRDAMLVDDESNARVVQLMDMASRPSGFDAIKAGTSGNGYVRAISGDSLFLDPLPTSISDSVLDVSDAESVVVYSEMIVKGAGGSGECKITITPVIMGLYDDAGTPTWDVACLGQPFSLHPVSPRDNTTAPTNPSGFIRLNDSTHGEDFGYVTMPQVFPTLGAERIGFHVNIEFDIINNPIVSGKLFAFKTSCAGRNTGDDNDTNNGVWGGRGFFGEE